jgi:chitin disaccharide deacetylase
VSRKVARNPRYGGGVRIIVNADDFGMSSDTLRATTECFEEGLLTSASLMIGMSASEEAFEFARTHPEFSFGVHLQFVGDGKERPLSPPHLVPALVDDDGRLLPTNVVRMRALRRGLPVEQIVRETVAQVEFVQQAGIPVSHVDSHRHLHKFAQFRTALGRALPGLGIRRVRNVQDVYLRRPAEHPTYWFGPAWRRALMRSFATTDHFYMPTTAHDENWSRVAAKLPAGASLEVGLHPGSEDPWRALERRSLPDFVASVRRDGHTLVNWSAI